MFNPIFVMSLLPSYPFSFINSLVKFFSGTTPCKVITTLLLKILNKSINNGKRKALIFPPNKCIIFLQMDNPSPVPPKRLFD